MNPNFKIELLFHQRAIGNYSFISRFSLPIKISFNIDKVLDNPGDILSLSAQGLRRKEVAARFFYGRLRRYLNLVYCGR
jgi:hypothetical protein